MDSLRDIYKRFISNYRTETGGINLYPQFDSDLKKLLLWIKDENDWSILDVDCSWRQPDEKEE